MVVRESWDHVSPLPSWYIVGRYFNREDQPLGSDFQINSYTTGRQRDATIGSNDYGDTVIAWSSDGSTGSDDSGYSITARLYSSGRLFVDDFELGDACGWTTAIPDQGCQD